MKQPTVTICPYCGLTQRPSERCSSCRGLFESLSRQATHNAMGPWYIHAPDRAFLPGCSYETLAALIERGQITKNTIIRGPTTKQFWTVARHAAGASHLLGYCHACDAAVDPEDHGCHECGVPFGAYLDRNHLGLPEVRPLPGEVPDPGPTNGHARDSLRPTPRGLSAFARDEELFAPIPGVIETAPPPPSLVDDVMNNPAVRGLRRQVRRQQRWIQWLTVVVVVLTITSLIVTLVATNTLNPGGDADTATVTPARDQDLVPGRAVGVATPVDAERVVPTPEVTEVASPSLAAAEDAVAIPEPGLPGVYLEALAEVEAGADVTRAIPDRLASYQSALGLFRSLDELAPPETLPPDLASRIEEVEEAIERLELKAFFP